LSSRSFLCGEVLTECDVRCFTTLVKFDSAYFNAFRCNIGHIRSEFPNLHRYLEQLYGLEPFRRSCQGMIFGYPLFYFCICRWKGRRLSNMLRLAEVSIFAMLFALAPDTPPWRYWLASLCCVPLRITNYFVDPLPNRKVFF